jgi:protein-disulfide isomerase
MNTETKALLIVGLLTIILLIGGVFFLSAKQPKVTKTAEGQVFQIDYSKGQKIGTDSAKLKLVEFGDLRCPSCKAYEPTVEQIRTNPDVQVIFRNFAFLGPASTLAGNAAECAGEQGKFWQMHDWFYANQPPESDISMFTVDKLTDVAGKLGANQDQFKACLNSVKYQQNISDALSDGQSLGVSGTPTFFLNGKKLELSSPADLANTVNQADK